jgi:hypothetical protein
MRISRVIIAFVAIIVTVSAIAAPPVPVAPPPHGETFLAVGAMYLNGAGASVGIAHKFASGGTLLAQALFVRDLGDDGYARVTDAFDANALTGTCAVWPCNPPAPVRVATPSSSRVGVALTFLFGPGGGSEYAH